MARRNSRPAIMRIIVRGTRPDARTSIATVRVERSALLDTNGDSSPTASIHKQHSKQQTPKLASTAIQLTPTTSAHSNHTWTAHQSHRSSSPSRPVAAAAAAAVAILRSSSTSTTISKTRLGSSHLYRQARSRYRTSTMVTHSTGRATCPSTMHRPGARRREAPTRSRSICWSRG